MPASLVVARAVLALQQRVDSLHVDTRAPGDTMTVFHPPREITAVQQVIRWFFSVPQWVQLSGALLAVTLGIVALVVIWRERAALREFVRERHLTTPIRWKVVFGIVAIGVVGTLVTSSVSFFTYSQQNNQFCVSCHTLHDEVFQRFQQSKHHRIANLRCHDCHDEPLLAEMRQVGLWMIRRPSAVGPHAPVPRAVCANCHVMTNADSSWKRIVATAGHAIHVASDTAKALKIECLTCHGVSAHRFVPVAQTCAQSGCHEQTKFQLGKMSGQTSLHCTVCHDFTAAVGDQASVDSAKRAMTPTNENCLSCHAMQRRMAEFVPANDPHKGRCGACHDPHTQTEPAESWQTCSSAGCHARADTLTAFHRGITAPALADCASCHKAHDWKVKGESCVGCHQDIYSDRRSAAHAAAATTVAAAQARSQPASEPIRHSEHRGLACTACHTTTGDRHGALLVRTKTDCLTCHHGPEPKAGAGPMACTQCHRGDQLARAPATQPVTIRTSVSTSPRTRPLPFTHARHTRLECTACHATPVTRAVANDCTSCHADHHTATRACISCHAGAQPFHKRAEVHQGCTGSGCHQDKAALAFSPTRNVCLTCHNDKVNHKAGGDCAKCHQVQWTPNAAREGTPR
jgi:nitrate/TMAO reductase-like tetraheme cytochrome c subunit